MAGNPKDRRCTARNRQGEQCRRTAAPGATVCAAHGAKAPQVKAKAAERLARAAAEEAVATYGLPVDIDPHLALLAEVHRTAGHVAWLGDIVASLDHENTDDSSGLLQYRKKEGILWRAPSVWVELYQEERKHLVAVCSAAIKAGVAERQVRLAEEQGALVMQVLQQVILALPVEHRETARKAAAQQLRLVAAS